MQRRMSDFLYHGYHTHQIWYPSTILGDEEEGAHLESIFPIPPVVPTELHRNLVCLPPPLVQLVHRRSLPIEHDVC